MILFFALSELSHLSLLTLMIGHSLSRDLVNDRFPLHVPITEKGFSLIKKIVKIAPFVICVFSFACLVAVEQATVSFCQHFLSLRQLSDSVSHALFLCF